MSIADKLKLPAYDLPLVNEDGLIDPLWYELNGASRQVIISQEASIAGNTAAIQQEATTRAAADSAFAALITTIQAQIAAIDASVSLQAIAVAVPVGAYAAYDVRVRVNNVSSNLKIIVYETSPGVFKGVIRMDADQVEIGSSASGTFVPLTTFDSGTSTVYINGQVKANKDNLVPGSATNREVAPFSTYTGSGEQTTIAVLADFNLTTEGGDIAIAFSTPNLFGQNTNTSLTKYIMLQILIDNSVVAQFNWALGPSSTFSRPESHNWGASGIPAGSHNFKLRLANIAAGGLAAAENIQVTAGRFIVDTMHR